MSVYYTPKLTDAEARTILGGDHPDATGAELARLAHERIHERAEAFIREDILCCDSWLIPVMEACNVDGFAIEEWQNLYPEAAGWSLEECREWLDEHGIDYPSDPDVNPWHRSHTPETLAAWARQSVTGLSLTGEASQARKVLAALIEAEKIDGLEEWQDAVRNADPDPAEPYEWWRVSKWLADKIDEAGEVVIDNGYGCWWGRCCTGQSIILDGTIQRIAHGLLAS